MVGMVIGLATGVDYMSNLMFSIAGPHIEGGVLASQDVYLWAVTAYAAAASLAILVMGRLADHMTYRRHTLLSLVVFIAGTLMCAAAEGGTMLIVGRAVQGFGGGPMLSTSRIFVQHSPAHERRTMMKGMIYGIFGLSCVSPMLSAALTEQFGWRAIFVAQLLVAVVVSDAITKALAQRWLTLPELPHDVLGNAVRFTLVYNPGAAFGISLGAYSRWIFMALTALALAILARLYAATERGNVPRTLALALVCGGALGNLMDRVWSGLGVVDFIDIGLRSARWPTFNVADVAVSTGAVLLAIVLWGEDREASAAASVSSPPMAERPAGEIS